MNNKLLQVKDPILQKEDCYYLPFLFSECSLEDFKYLENLLTKSIEDLSNPCSSEIWNHNTIKTLILCFKSNIVLNNPNSKKLLHLFEQIGMEELDKQISIDKLNFILSYVISKIENYVD